MTTVRSNGVLVHRDGDSRPIIVLCHARTGSTLLAYLLNANPILYCPAETNLGQTLVGIARWVAEIARDPEGSPGTELVAEPQLALIRAFVNALYSARLQAEGATRWCDKSLGTYVASGLIDRLFPDAQFICLYRNFTDFAASALEACPFGLRNYGFDPYAHETPSNAIFSLARYWVDHVREIAAFQDAHPQTAVALTYEALVQDFAATISRLGTFLDAPWDATSLSSSNIFRQRFWTGCQDHKIVSTTQIRADSVNRQWILPVDMIPPPIIEAINELHTRLGYPSIDEPGVTDVNHHTSLDSLRAAELDRLVTALTARMEQIKGACVATRPVVIRLDLIDVGTSLKLTPLQAEVERLASATWDVRLTTTIQALKGVLAGPVNVSSLTTSGHLKTELSTPDTPDLEVLATMHHFWKAVSNPQYTYSPVPSLM